MGRPRIHDDALRERLLDLAAATVAVDGPFGLSVRALARSADTSTAAVYTLFGGMPGLMEHVYARAFGRLGAGQRAVGVSDDPVADILALGRAYRESALADPNSYRMMFGAHAGTDELPPAVAGEAALTFEPLVDAVRRAIEAGRMPSTPSASVIATALWANVHGLVTVELGGFRPPAASDPAEFFDVAARTVVDGWCSLT